MTHLEPGLFSGRRRRQALASPLEKHLSHTQAMLAASALAAATILGIAAMLLSSIL